MQEEVKSYLTKEQLVKKYQFLTLNMMKNILFKNIDGFREKVTTRIGRRILFDEELFLKYLSENKHSQI